MKKIGITFVCLLLAACGGSSSGSQEPAAPRAEAATVPDTEAAAYEAPAETSPPVDEAMPEAAPVEPTPAPEPVATVLVAKAELKAAKDDAAMGTVTFESSGDGQVTITGQFNGLKKNGVHAFYIHENGDCSSKGKKVGGHLNPTKAKHGPPASSTRHAGDFGNLTADEAGNALFSMTTDSVTMEADRPDSVINRAVVIHAKKDDKKGSGGAVLACGVVTLGGAE